MAFSAKFSMTLLVAKLLMGSKNVRGIMMARRSSIILQNLVKIEHFGVRGQSVMFFTLFIYFLSHFGDEVAQL